MATVFGHASVQFLDKLGVTVSSPYYLNIDDTKTLAAISTEVASLISSLDAISDSQITGANLQVEITLPGGLKSAPADTAENERTALFNFSQSGSPYRFGVDVPAIADSKIANGKVDLTDTNIQDFITLLKTAGTNLTYVSTAIKALVALIDALLSFRKHRKAETRRSLEAGS